MKTDRELLELAARAYWGDEIDDTCSIRWSEADNAILYMHGDNQDHNGQDVELCWNPLEAGYDTFSLMVKLGIKVMPYPIYSPEKSSVIASRKVPQTDPESEDGFMGPECIELYGDDPEAATKRAIVRAAAAIAEATHGPTK